MLEYIVEFKLKPIPRPAGCPAVLWARLQILDALHVKSGVLVIPRSDLAAPEDTLDRARGELAETSLVRIPAV